MVALLLLSGAATPAPSTAAVTPAATAAPDSTHTVTLVTGDVVRVSDAGGGRHTVDVTRPHGAHGGVRAETIGKDLYVLPDEALPYLAADQVDRRLFDVTALIEQGYDDAHSSGVPLILSSPAAAALPPVPAGAGPIRALPSIHGRAVRVAKNRTRQAWTALVAKHANAGAAKVWLDARKHADLAQSTAQIGAPAAWAAGIDGAGVKVAVLDTGADLDHPDLAGRVSQAVSFVPGETARDGNGHGTHTLSTVGGSGSASGGTERGVAPGADLLVGKVLSDEGYGADSWIIAGMEWAAGQGARVISMSLGGSSPSDGNDPLSQAVNRLTEQTGALFVIAAGNADSEAAISSPGAADAALTVAAVDSDDQLASFSSMGPRIGDYALKPDIAAPGVDILAAKAGGTADGGWYQTLSGTSMATPHVAGAAALLAEQHPQWRAGQLKDALMSSSRQLSTTAYQSGAGRVDVAAALRATITATGSAYLGFDAWPQPGGRTAERMVTYANSGDAAVTLDLRETVAVAGGPYDTDPQADAGQAAPDGMFGLSAGTVTVPAHGTAAVTASARLDLAAAGRRYLGQVVATDRATGAAVRTQVGLYREDERYTLHVDVKDRAGAAVSGYLEIQQAGVPDPTYVFVDGTADLRLRAGTYSVVSYAEVAGSHGPDSAGLALLGAPEVVLDHDRSLVLDARKAREVTAQVPRTTEDRMLYLDWYRSFGADSVIASQYLLPAVYDTMYALPTAPVTTGDFEFEARWRKAYPLLTVADRGRPLMILGLAGSSFYDGRGDLDAVYAGAGTPADYAGLRAKGRAVLVTRSDALTGAERARNAAGAGARLLIVVNDRPGKLTDYVGTDDGGLSAVPVVSVTAREGANLIPRARAGRLRLTVAGVPDSPYVYDLVDPHPGRIPVNLAYRPRPADLATVDMRFHSLDGHTRYPSGEFRWDYRPYRTYGLGALLRTTMPGTRVDYASAQPGTAWAEAAVTGPGPNLVSSAEVHALRRGARTVDDWFGPVVRPRDGGGFWSSTRDELSIAFNVQPWADGGAGHAGYLQDGDTKRLTVYQDGTLVGTFDWASGSLYPIPAGPATYTLDLVASRDPAVFRLSPRTHTVWTVKSLPAGPGKVDLMPVLQLDYLVGADLAGNVPGGRQQIGLTAGHLAGAVGAGRIAGATLSVSYDDGVTWRPAALSGRAGGGWSASFVAPRAGYVSLRARAWDSAGNAVTSEVIRAYGLR
ncbi:S8 family serine peptidase [Actinoplanes sp. KI2]|uniref:S8 family serine peptidase n=1 Tax=Actinoplanes sp. KI2 TaxID=2983315 RepID=UPI0021D59AA1|nr:S8 family serine peptidase [Actinoplanes sp. KI2]MCU7729317.1 S8 family serine peptidase [Actinoplanes sp. KI2]